MPEVSRGVRRRRRALFLPCILAALLAGCTAAPPRDGVVAVRPQRATIAAFSFDGRIAVKQDDSRHSGNIAWQHKADADAILLTTPLGQGVAQIERDARGARLTGADREVLEAADWEGLSARVFGVALPLSGLPRWLLGDVAPTGRDAQGRPQTALADGWEVRYLDYESDAPGALPVLMEFRRGDIELRLKIDAWVLE